MRRILVLLSLASALSPFQCYNSDLIENEIDDYINTVLVYYLKRNVGILTHFSCFAQTENVRVSSELSKQSIQSRFEVDFDKKIILDTPPNTIQGFVVHIKCDHFMDIFRDGDHAIMFRDNNFWLFIDNNIDVNVSDALAQYRSTFKELNALPLSDLFIAKQTEYLPMRWILFDAYKIDYGNDIDIYPNGIIETSVNGTLMLSGLNVFARRRQNLKGLSIPCGLVIAYPEKFTYVDDPVTNHIDIFTKAYIKLAQNLREDLNIDCQVIQVDNYGYLENGTFSGIMGLFQRKKIRMALHAFTMRPERLLFTDFAGNIFKPRTPLIFRQPPLSTASNIYVLTLAMDVWICVFILIVVVTFVMLLQFLHPLIRSTFHSFDVLTFILGALCQQGSHLSIPTISGRLFVLTTFLSMLALFTSYSASIVALLQSPSDYIKTLDDLIASPMKVAIQESGYAHFYVTTNYSGISELYEKKIKPHGSKGWIYDPFVGIERVRKELFAFQVDSPSAYKAIDKTFSNADKCSLKEFQVIVLQSYTIPVEKNSGYKELVKQRVTWQKEVGLLQREEIRWIRKKPECETGQAEFIPVDMNVIKPVIILLLIGYVLSIIVALSERIYWSLKTKRQIILIVPSGWRKSSQ